MGGVRRDIPGRGGVQPIEKRPSGVSSKEQKTQKKRELERVEGLAEGGGRSLSYRKVLREKKKKHMRQHRKKRGSISLAASTEKGHFFKSF